MNIIIPMAGLGSRFTKYGFSTNKYLLPIDTNLTKMIEMAILTLNAPPIETQFIFILREEDNEINTELREYLKQLCQSHLYKCVILSVNYLTEGPTSTAYLAKEYVNNEIPLIISNSDQILDWNYNNFINKSTNYDGSVLTYIPKYELIIGNTDKHSFVRFDNITKKPVEFVEKTIISNEALVGVHYYKKGKYFIESAEYLFENNIRAPNGEFYLSHTYQAMLNKGYEIGTYCLTDTEHFYPVGEPEDYFEYYNYNAQFFSADISNYNTIDIINNCNFFKIEHASKNNTITLNNSIFIPFCNDFPCYNTGKTMDYTFSKDSYYLQIPNLKTSEENSNLVNLNDYTRGWLIGDFEPNIKKTTEYEIGILQHKQNEKWQFHYHKDAIEINIILSGEMIINNIKISKNTIFVFDKNMISCPLFLTDCKIICIKIPSIPIDKYYI